MYKKITSSILILFFLTSSLLLPIHLSAQQTTSFPIIEIKKTLITDTLDQSQSNHSGNAIQFTNESIWFGQQIRPRLNILTKISIFLGRDGDFNDQSTFVVSFRKHLHKELASIRIKPAEISKNGSWIDCDFDCIFLDVNLSYYIVCHLEKPSEPSYVEWFFDNEDPYPKGKPFYSEDGYFWDQYIHKPGFQDIDFCFNTYGFQNNPPKTPEKPNGPTEGQYEKSYEFSCQTTDQDIDELYYQWSWGDGETSDWLGPYSTSQLCTTSHTWEIKGSYLIKVKAKDEWGMETDWSEPLTIRMKKNKLSHSGLDALIDFIRYFINSNQY